MQLMLQCMLRPKFFEDTFENTQWKKSNNATSVMIMKRHLKMHRGETVKKVFQILSMGFVAHWQFPTYLAGRNISRYSTISLTQPLLGMIFIGFWWSNDAHSDFVTLGLL